MPGGPELIIILVVVLVLFGGSQLPKLAKNTQYYWKVVTKDANGTVAGPVWTFKTRP